MSAVVQTGASTDLKGMDAVAKPPMNMAKDEPNDCPAIVFRVAVQIVTTEQ